MQQFLASWKGYRTFLINSISILGTTILWIGPDLLNLMLKTDLSPLVSEEYLPILIVMLSALNICLRKITTTPMFQKA